MWAFGAGRGPHLGARLGARLGSARLHLVPAPPIVRRVLNLALAATQLRVARATDQLQAVVAFYREGLGLEEIGRFTGHAGYDGVMFGLPDRSYHLEFTQRADGSPCPPPSQDNLLVFYVPDAEARQKVGDRLIRLGHGPVAAENPWWEKIEALTFEDPDGWRVVIAPTTGI